VTAARTATHMQTVAYSHPMQYATVQLPDRESRLIVLVLPCRGMLRFSMAPAHLLGGQRQYV
jgi:hypothetical protein